MPEIIKLHEESIDALLQKAARQGPSFFQLNFFVIGKEPTLQAKMHKCLQEIKDRSNAITSVLLEIEELQDVNALYGIELKKLKKLTAEEREIRVRQIKRKMYANENQIRSLGDKIVSWGEEIKFLRGLYDQIEENIPLKAWDDYEVQLEYWSEKMAQEIKSRLIMNAPVDIEVIKTALALPDHSPIKKQLIEHIKIQEKKSLTDK